MLFTIPALAVDSDNDGIEDAFDNCPFTSNPAQEDLDADSFGDVCDNCPVDANAAQEDADADGVGDVCDNCPLAPNPDQTDSDADGVGDACEGESDTDGDGVDDPFDNCPNVYNPTQEDSDGDGVGDHCDNCPFVPNPAQEDTDGDGNGDACDPDDDDDGIPDSQDNCPLAYNPAQEDQDSDGLGDVCDPCPTDPDNDCSGCPDADGDGVCDDEDNCPLYANPTQSDIDSDGLGDICDPCPSDPDNLCPPCARLPRLAVSWWPGDGDATDIYGPNSPTQTIGSPYFETAMVLEGMGFHGVDGQVVPDDPSLDIDTFDSASILAWVRVDGVPAPGEYAVVDKRTGNSGSWNGYLLSGVAAGPAGHVTLRFSMSDGFSMREAASHPVSTGTFHHVAVVLDGYRESLTLYVDGRLHDTAMATAAVDATSDAAFHIGHPSLDMSGNTLGLDGVVDELMFFYRDLTWCEVLAVHGAGEEGACRGDRDMDSVVDYLDNCPEYANAGQSDIDHDSAGDVCDCRVDDFQVHHHPGEALGLLVGVEFVPYRLEWCDKHYDAGQETEFTLARGMIDELPVGSGGSERCMASALAHDWFDDVDDPPAGRGFWYILRAHNGCGVGTWGHDSYGIERTSLSLESCPLSERELCGNTGGYWDYGSCGHYDCGAPPDCDGIIPGCDCGFGRNFFPGAGCQDDPNCP